MSKAFVPPIDTFDKWFTNREQEIDNWRSILSRDISQPFPGALWYRGVPGAGKTFLKTRFQQFCQNNDVPYLNLELDHTKGGTDATDAAVIITALAARLPMPLPRTALTLARIVHLESGTSSRNNQFESELTGEVVGAGFEALLTRLETFSSGGLLSLSITEGIRWLSASAKATRALQQSEEGRNLSQWLRTTRDPAALRVELWRILRADLAHAETMVNRAVRAVLFIDSLEHATPGAILMLRTACESLTSSHECKLPTVMMACFSQLHNQINLGSNFVKEVEVQGISKESALKYCVEKRGVRRDFIDNVLEESKESLSGQTYHPLTLGLSCDYYSMIQEDTTLGTIRPAQRSSSTAEDMAARILATLDDYQQRKLRKLAHTIYFDRTSVAYAFSVQSDEEKIDSILAWLKSYSFVQDLSPDIFCLHNLVRRVLLERTTDEEKSRWHAGWAEFSEREIDIGTATATERFLYHLFAKDPEAALTTVSAYVTYCKQRGLSNQQSALTVAAEFTMCYRMTEDQIGTPHFRVRCILDWCGFAMNADVGNWLTLAIRTAARLKDLLSENWLHEYTEEYLRCRIDLASLLLRIGQRTLNVDRIQESAAILMRLMANSKLTEQRRLEAIAYKLFVETRAFLSNLGYPILNSDELHQILNRAETIFLERGESLPLAETKGCKGHLYYCLWASSLDERWLVRGKEAYEEGLYLSDSLPDSATINSILFNMGVTMTALGTLSREINYLLSAEAIYRRLLSRSGHLAGGHHEMEATLNLAAVTLSLAKFTNSQSYCLLSIDMLKSLLMRIDTSGPASDCSLYRARAIIGLGTGYLDLWNYRDQVGCMSEIVSLVEPLLSNGSLNDSLPLRAQGLFLVAQAKLFLCEEIPGLHGECATWGPDQSKQMDSSIDMMNEAVNLCVESRTIGQGFLCKAVLNEMLIARDVLNSKLGRRE